LKEGGLAERFLKLFYRSNGGKRKGRKGLDKVKNKSLIEQRLEPVVIMECHPQEEA
jgi:hypothetical protein